MKNIIYALLLCVCAVPLHADGVLTERFWSRMLIDLWDANSKAEAFAQTVDSQMPVKQLQLGSHLFSLAYVDEVKDHRNKTVSTYIYRPVSAKASYQEAVSIVPRTGAVQIIRNPGNRLVGPINWKYTSYEVSEIVVTIYPDADLRSKAWAWKRQFGKDCVSFYTTLLSSDYVVDMLHTPTRAFTIKNKRMVVVSVHAASAEFGPYRRDCRVRAPGKLYDQFTKMADKLQKILNK